MRTKRCQKAESTSPAAKSWRQTSAESIMSEARLARKAVDEVGVDEETRALHGHEGPREAREVEALVGHLEPAFGGYLDASRDRDEARGREVFAAVLGPGRVEAHVAPRNGRPFSRLATFRGWPSRRRGGRPWAWPRLRSGCRRAPSGQRPRPPPRGGGPTPSAHNARRNRARCRRRSSGANSSRGPGRTSARASRTRERCMGLSESTTWR